MNIIDTQMTLICGHLNLGERIEIQYRLAPPWVSSLVYASSANLAADMCGRVQQLNTNGLRHTDPNKGMCLPEMSKEQKRALVPS